MRINDIIAVDTFVYFLFSYILVFFNEIHFTLILSNASCYSQNTTDKRGVLIVFLAIAARGKVSFITICTK